MRMRPLKRVVGHHAASNALALGGVVVSVVFGYLAVRDIRWHEVSHTLSTSSYWWVVPALLALALGNLLRAIRWQFMFDPRTRPPFWPTLAAMLVGQFFNNVLPARAGEAARIIALHRSTDASRAETLTTVALERVFDVLVLLLLLFGLLPWFPHVTWLRAAGALAIGLTVVLVALIVVLAWFGERPIRFLVRPLTRLPFLSPERVDQAADGLNRGLASVRQARVAAAGISWTLVSWVALSASNWILMQGFDLGIGPSGGFLVAITTGLGLVIPSSPAAVGVFEAATIVALKAYGIPDARALSYALVLHAMNLVPYLAAGPVVLRVDRLLVWRRA